MLRPLFSLRQVRRQFRSGRGAKETVRALDGVDLDIIAGQVTALVGHSGAGKTTLARVLLRLETIDDGTILYRDEPLAAVAANEFRRTNQMVFQNPLLAVNPSFRVRRIVEEPLLIAGFSRRQREERATAALEMVEIAGRLFVRIFGEPSPTGDVQLFTFRTVSVLVQHLDVDCMIVPRLDWILVLDNYYAPVLLAWSHDRGNDTNLV